MKAYVRGVTISYMAYKNKEKRKEREALTKKLEEAENNLLRRPGDEIFKESWRLARHRLNILDQEEIVGKIKRAKHYLFENANKSGRWLAYRLKKQNEKSQILVLEDSKGNLLTKEEDKLGLARDFYEALYKQEEVEAEAVEQYLMEANLPQITEEEKDILNRLITIEELETALTKIKKNKSPGPDGLPGEIYAKFEEPLKLELLGIFNGVLTSVSIPETWREAYLSLILKEGTDPKHIANYRPISLLNSDYKLFMSIIAERMKKILNIWIHKDQNGFLPGRQIRNNLRTVLNVIEYYEHHSDKQLALVFVDTQKAFDNLNWSFMINQINLMGFGTNFRKMIENIYHNQKANIVINGDRTKVFPIQKGVRQGCPLSPLLFILALEVLLRKIRANKDIKDLKIRNEIFKAQAFADDVALIVEDPLVSGPKVLQEIENYGKVAGFKLNKTKTKIIVKNVTETQKIELEELLGIQIVKKTKYLGIWLTSRHSSLKENNYIPLLQKIQLDLERWKKIKLSLIGKIAAIKMNILPKIIFLFQNIPVKLGKKFFSELNKSIRLFLWEGKKSRISYRILQGKRNLGGFGLPDWETYQKAAKLVWIRDWITLHNRRILTLEGHDLQEGWHAQLWNPREKKSLLFCRHKVRETLIQIWVEIRQRFYTKVPNWLSILEALIDPNRRDIQNFPTYKEILDDKGSLKSLDLLRDQGLNIDWWTYFQINSRYQKDRDRFGIESKYRNLDKILLGQEKKMLARLYNVLLDEDRAEIIARNQLGVWEKNIGYNINFNEWEEAWNRNYYITKAVSYRENQYKMFHRWHLAPARIAKMIPNASPTCWKCGKEVGTFFHMWWSCQITKKFWLKIRAWLKEIIGEDLELAPEIFLLGITRERLAKEKTQLLIHIITAARLVFAKTWKDNASPSEESVINKILECAEMSNLTNELNNGEKSKYYDVWGRWYNWMRNRKNI